METILWLIAGVFIASYVDVKLKKDYGVEPKAVYERQCKNMPPAELQRCSEDVKTQRETNNE